MVDYVKATNFFVKDSLLVGNPDKIVKGSEIDTEFNNIATAVSSKANYASPNLTGLPTAPTAAAGTNTSQLATTAFVKSAVDANSANVNITGGTIDDVDITGGTIVDLDTPLAVNSGGTGKNTLALNNVLLGNGTAAVKEVAPGAAGNLLISDGTTWTSGAGLNGNLSSTGYQVFPGGLIIQWGETGLINGDSTISVNFPTAFLVACFQVVACHTRAPSAQDAGMGTSNLTTSSFTMINEGGASSTARWIAIGK